jgi:uroporphyrinogen-III synthase
MNLQMVKNLALQETKSAKNIQKILITQARPESDKSPYFEMARKFNVKVDFQPFLRVVGIRAMEFR